MVPESSSPRTWPAVLGWGSLIWSPRGLQQAGDWSFGGPRLPIEFSRISSDGRLTLVIDKVDGEECGTWFCPSPLNLSSAITNLAAREGCDARCIGAVGADRASPGAPRTVLEERIMRWCSEFGFPGAVWTGLPPTFKVETGTPFTVGRAMGYLDSLKGSKRERAFEYIRRAPVTTDTPLRRAFHARWGGSPHP